jgi:uncharacterized protein (DUF1330 family)
MAAYVIAEIRIKDPEKYEEYRLMVPATLDMHGGRYLVRGGETRLLEGEPQPNRLAVLEFESAERAVEWYESEDYRQLIPIRQAASEFRLVLVKGV